MIIINKNPCAVACIKGSEDYPYLLATAKFYTENEGVLIVISAKGLPESDTGFFALHIHEIGNCQGESFENTGGHFNPRVLPHPLHSGDLPPLMSCDGEAFMAVYSDRISVKDVVGRSIIIHRNSDDFETQPSGNAGDKIGCGVIKSCCRNSR